MALTRKFLAALGVEADKIEEIITAHTEVTDALKAERDGYKKQVAEYDSLKAENDDLKKQVQEGAKYADYKAKYEAEHEEFEIYKKNITAKETRSAKENAYKALLKEAGVSDKRINAVLKVTKLDDLELDENGKCKEAEKLTEGIKQEWSDFIQSDFSKGADTAHPPKNEGKGHTYSSKEEIMAIKDASERQAAIAENPDLFGY